MQTKPLELCTHKTPQAQGRELLLHARHPGPWSMHAAGALLLPGVWFRMADCFLLGKRAQLQPEVSSSPRINAPHCQHKANNGFFRLGVPTLMKSPVAKYKNKKTFN